MTRPIGKGPGLGGALPPGLTRGLARTPTPLRGPLGSGIGGRQPLGAGIGTGSGRGERSPLSSHGDGPFGMPSRAYRFLLPGAHHFSAHHLAIECASGRKGPPDGSVGSGSGSSSDAPQVTREPSLRHGKAIKAGGIVAALNALADQDASRTRAVIVRLKPQALSGPEQWAVLLAELGRAVWHGTVTILDAENHPIVRRAARPDARPAPFIFALHREKTHAAQWERLCAILMDPAVVRAVGATPIVLQYGFVLESADDAMHAHARDAVGTLVSSGYVQVTAANAEGATLLRVQPWMIYAQPVPLAVAAPERHRYPEAVGRVLRSEEDDGSAESPLPDQPHRVLDERGAREYEVAQVRALLEPIDPAVPVELTCPRSSQHLYPPAPFLGMRRQAAVTLDARESPNGFGVHRMVLHFDPAHEGELVRADVTVAFDELLEQSEHLKLSHLDPSARTYHSLAVGAPPVPVVIKIVSRPSLSLQAVWSAAQLYCRRARQARMSDVTIVYGDRVITGTIPGRIWRSGVPQLPAVAAAAPSTDSADVAATAAAEHVPPVAASEGLSADADAEPQSGDGASLLPPPPPPLPPDDGGPASQPEPPRGTPEVPRAVPVTTAIPQPPLRTAVIAQRGMPDPITMPEAVQEGGLAAVVVWLQVQTVRPQGVITMWARRTDANLALLAATADRGMPVTLIDPITAGYFHHEPSIGFDVEVNPDRLGHVVRALCAAADGDFAPLRTDPLMLTLARVDDLPEAALQQWVTRAVARLRDAGYAQVVVRTASGAVLAASDAITAVIPESSDDPWTTNGDATDSTTLQTMIDGDLRSSLPGTRLIQFHGTTVPEWLRARFAAYETAFDVAGSQRGLLIETDTERYEFGCSERLRLWTYQVQAVAQRHGRTLTKAEAELVAEVLLARYCIVPQSPAAVAAANHYRTSPLDAAAMQSFRAEAFHFATPHVVMATPVILRLTADLVPAVATQDAAAEPAPPTPDTVLPPPAPTADDATAASTPSHQPLVTSHPSAVTSPQPPVTPPQPLPLVQTLWARIGATARPELASLLERLWVMEQARPGVPSWEIAADGVLTVAQAAQAVRVSIAAATAHDCAMTDPASLRWLLDDVMPSPEMFGDPATMGMDQWPTICITPADFRDLVEAAVSAVKAVLAAPPPADADAAPGPTAPAPDPTAAASAPSAAASSHSHGFQRRALVRYRLGILRTIQPPVVDASVLTALERLPPDIAFSLLSHNDAAMMAGFLRDQLPRPDRDGVPRLVKLLWAYLGCYQTGYAATLAKWWRTFVAEQIARDATLQARLEQLRTYEAADTVSFNDLDPELLHAAVMVGFTVAVTAALHRTGDTNLLHIQTALESIRDVNSARTWESVAGLSFDAVLASVSALEPPEESDREAFITLSGDWPQPFLVTDAAQTAQQRLTANAPRIKALVEAMVAGHPVYHGDIRALDITKPPEESVAPIQRRFKTSDGRQKIGNRHLTLAALAEIYWDLVTAPGCPGAHLPELFEPTLAVKLDCLVEHLFDQIRYGRTRFTRMSRAAFAAKAKEWDINRLLPVLRGDSNAVAKLLGTKLFSDHWRILSPLERKRFVEGFAQLPLAQGPGPTGRPARTRVSLHELAEQERVLIDFLRARNLRLQGLGGEDIFHLYEIYRFVTHVRFGRDYSTAMHELAYRLGERPDPNPDPAARITAETDPVLLAVLRQAYNYYQRREQFGALPARLRPETLNLAQWIGAQWLTERSPVPTDDPQFPIDPHVKFLLDGARLGKTRQMFAAWQQLIARGEVEADGAVLYVTRSTNMDEVAKELQLICNDGQAPSVGMLRWEEGQKGVAVTEVAGKQVRIVHYQNLWRLNPYEWEREIAKRRARAAKLRASVADADPREAKGARASQEIAELDAVIEKLEAQLPALRTQWEQLHANVAVTIVDEAQEAENPSEEVKQANGVRDAIAHVRGRRAEVGKSPMRLWWATASLYNSDPGHIQSLLETSFPTHELYRHGAAFRAAHTHTMDGLLKLHNDLMGQFSLRRTVEEVYEVGEEIPAIREVPYAELGRYEHSREQLRIYRAIYLHFMEWARARNATLPPDKQIDLEQVNPLQIFQLMEWTTQHPALVGGSDDSPMIAEAVRIARENAAAGRKTVIVCQYTAVVDQFLAAFAAADVGAERFDGAVEGLTDQRYRFAGRRLVADPAGVRVRKVSVNLDRFNSDPTVPVLVANVKSIRAGLRVNADDIILATEPISATERYQLVHRIQNLNASGEAKKDAVRVITMVGVHPPRFLDDLEDPALIALFEAGSLGQLIRAYVQDNQIVWELILSGEVSPEGMERLLQKKVIAGGVLDPLRPHWGVRWGRRDPAVDGAASRKTGKHTAHLSPALAPLLDMCENGALTPRDKERARHQIARLARGFQSAGVAPHRLVTVIQKLARRGERGFSWADLDVVVDLLEASDLSTRDVVLAQLPRAMEAIAEAGLRFAELAEQLQPEASPLAFLTIPALLAGRLWHTDAAGAIVYFRFLLRTLAAVPDIAARDALAQRLFVALARFSSRPEDLYDDTLMQLFARPRREPPLGLSEQVAALEQLAVLQVVDRENLPMLLAEGSGTLGNVDDTLESLQAGGAGTWQPLLHALRVASPGPRLLAALDALGRRPGQIEAVGTMFQRLEGAQAGAYRQLLLATLTENLPTYRAAAPGFLADAKSRREFWEPWGQERTTAMPDRVVGAQEMVTLLQREYERLMHHKWGLSLELFAALEEPWVAEAWTQYRDTEDREARAAQHHAVQADVARLSGLRSQVEAFFQPRRRRRASDPEVPAIELSADDLACLARYSVTPPDLVNAEAVLVYGQQLTTWAGRLQRVADWMELSRTLHQIFHDDADADPAAALAAVQRQIWALEDRREDGQGSLLADRVLDQLHQLRRQLQALIQCAAQEKASTAFADVSVTDTDDIAVLHLFTHSNADLVPRFRRGAREHLDTLLDVAGSRNRRWVVVRSHGRPIAVAVASVEKNQPGRPHIHLEWAWFAGGYDFRNEMLAHLQAKIADRENVAAQGGTPQPMQYGREGPGKKTPLLTQPLPFSPLEVSRIPSQDRVTLSSTGSTVGDNTVEAFSRINPQGTEKHDAVILRRVVSASGS
ncbi:MAG: hypothetical protein HY696_02475 [Deltaproteobacteria bacterium]|nr:hypothetical protein [Deltaproteobacteria bacterium]